MGKIFGRKGDDSATKQQQAKPPAFRQQQPRPQAPEPRAAEPVAAPVATRTAQGAPTVEWATLGKVPVAQCVPASPTFSQYNGQLSEVSAATVARLLGNAPQAQESKS